MPTYEVMYFYFGSYATVNGYGFVVPKDIRFNMMSLHELCKNIADAGADLMAVNDEGIVVRYTNG